MDTQKLKDKMLQLAIQGKLIEQDPNDEPASEILKKIEAEKKKLYKEGKIRKQKKLPPIKEEEKPFDIPESWEWVRLGEIGIWGSGATPKRSNFEYYENGNIPWIKTGELIDSYINDSEEKITEKALNETSVNLKPIGTVLIAMYGATIGKLGILNLEATTNQACCACTVYRGIYNKYLFFFLLSQRSVFKNMSEGGAQPNISKEKIIKNSFPFPPLNEQKRIVEKVDEVFKLIDNLDSDKEKLLDTIELTRNKVLQDAIQGKLIEQDPNDEPASELLKKIESEKKKLYKEGKIRKPKKLPPIKDEEKPFDIPESWEWVRLGNTCNIIMGQSPKGNTVGEEGIEFHQGKIFFGDKYLKESDKFTIKPKKIADIGDVILSVRAPVGTVNITERQICIGRGLCAVRPLLKIKTDFNYYWIKAFNETLLDKSTGTTFKAISMTTINELVIPLPPLNEQKRIVEKIDEIFNYCDLLEELLQD